MEGKDLERFLEMARKKKEKDVLHSSYSELTGKAPDFEVFYELLADSDGATYRLYQGIRPDFLYEGDDPVEDGVFMIWPEILDDDGRPLMDKKNPMDESGRATMWVINPDQASLHEKRIKAGVRGYWVFGGEKVAVVTVVKVVGLESG